MRSFSFILALLATPAWAGHTLTPTQQNVLEAWLAKHANYQRATDSDCARADLIKEMRSGQGDPKTALPGYHPYVATGDFNGDGEIDFAVVLIDRTKPANGFALLIFNGPYGTQTTEPNYLKADLDLKEQGLSFGPPGSKPYRLKLGNFFSDFFVGLLPSGTTYKLKASNF